MAVRALRVVEQGLLEEPVRSRPDALQIHSPRSNAHGRDDDNIGTVV